MNRNHMKILGIFVLSIAIVHCASTTATKIQSTIVIRGDGLDESYLPKEVRVDYAVFAENCSKCHALSRSLYSGIDDDEWWIRYVARMRRQPTSGISPEEAVIILRFLRYFSAEQRRIKAAKGA